MKLKSELYKKTMAQLETKISEKNTEIKSLKSKVFCKPSTTGFSRSLMIDSDLRSVNQPPVEKIETEEMGWSCSC